METGAPSAHAVVPIQRNAFPEIMTVSGVVVGAGSPPVGPPAVQEYATIVRGDGATVDPRRGVTEWPEPERVVLGRARAQPPAIESRAKMRPKLGLDIAILQ
jgi:hypothetical protein